MAEKPNTNYLCYMCVTLPARVFSSKRELLDHFITVHRENGRTHNYSCAVCFFTCSLSTTRKKRCCAKLLTHNLKHLQNEIKRECPIPDCGSFDTWEDYRNHVTDMHTNKDDSTIFQCHLPDYICWFTSNTPGSWHSHVSWEVTVWCEECGRKFANPRALSIHLKNNHMKYIPEYRREVKDVEDPFRKLEDDHNEKSVVNIGGISTNMMLRSKNKEQNGNARNLPPGKTDNSKIGKYSCSFCCKELTSEKGFNSHMKRRHGKPSRYTCQECGTLFKNKKVRDNHVERSCEAFHKNKGSFFSCERCGKRFNMYNSYRTHIIHNHWKENPLCCVHCGYVAPNSGLYDGHLALHPPSKGSKFFNELVLKQKNSKSRKLSSETETIVPQPEEALKTEWVPKYEVMDILVKEEENALLMMT